MAIPRINVWSVDSENIYLNWRVQDFSDIMSWNLYGDPTTTVTTKRIGEIPNIVTNKNVAAGVVLQKVSRVDFSIDPSQPFFFKITSVDPSGIESNLVDSLFVSVDSLDDVFKERTTDDDNPVYKNIIKSFGVTTDELVNVNQLLGRDANYMEVTTSADFTLKINSAFNDGILVTAANGLLLRRNVLRINRVFATIGSGTADVNFLVTGI